MFRILSWIAERICIRTPDGQVFVIMTDGVTALEPVSMRAGFLKHDEANLDDSQGSDSHLVAPETM